MLCGFLETFRRPAAHLETLERVAGRRGVAVATTLSLAAARFYGIGVPSYAVFRNATTGLATNVYAGDLLDADAVAAFALAAAAPDARSAPEPRSSEPRSAPDPDAGSAAEADSAASGEL